MIGFPLSSFKNPFLYWLMITASSAAGWLIKKFVICGLVGSSKTGKAIERKKIQGKYWRPKDSTYISHT